jgi:hypothetical protein
MPGKEKPTVDTNGKLVATKGSGHKAYAAKDIYVKKPNNEPIPGPVANEAPSAHLGEGATHSTKIDNQPIWTLKGWLDEPAQYPSGPGPANFSEEKAHGKMSFGFRGPAKATAGCESVKAEGGALVRTDDPTSQNHKGRQGKGNCKGIVQEGDGDADSDTDRELFEKVCRVTKSWGYCSHGDKSKRRLGMPRGSTDTNLDGTYIEVIVPDTVDIYIEMPPALDGLEIGGCPDHPKWKFLTEHETSYVKRHGCREEGELPKELHHQIAISCGEASKWPTKRSDNAHTPDTPLVGNTTWKGAVIGWSVFFVPLAIAQAYTWLTYSTRAHKRQFVATSCAGNREFAIHGYPGAEVWFWLLSSNWLCDLEVIQKAMQSWLGKLKWLETTVGIGKTNLYISFLDKVEFYLFGQYVELSQVGIGSAADQRTRAQRAQSLASGGSGEKIKSVEEYEAVKERLNQELERLRNDPDSHLKSYRSAWAEVARLNTLLEEAPPEVVTGAIEAERDAARAEAELDRLLEEEERIRKEVAELEAELDELRNPGIFDRFVDAFDGYDRGESRRKADQMRAIQEKIDKLTPKRVANMERQDQVSLKLRELHSIIDSTQFEKLEGFAENHVEARYSLKCVLKPIVKFQFNYDIPLRNLLKLLAVETAGVAILVEKILAKFEKWGFLPEVAVRLRFECYWDIDFGVKRSEYGEWGFTGSSKFVLGIFAGFYIAWDWGGLELDFLVGAQVDIHTGKPGFGPAPGQQVGKSSTICHFAAWGQGKLVLQGGFAMDWDLFGITKLDKSRKHSFSATQFSVDIVSEKDPIYVPLFVPEAIP